MTQDTRRAALRLALTAAVLIPVAVIIWRGFAVREVDETQPIDPPVKIKRSAKLAKGWEIILIPGRPGETTIASRIRSWYGLTLSRTELTCEETRPPAPEHRMVGTGEANAINAPKLTRVARTKVMEATGYDAGPHTNSWQFAGTTKLGWRARRGIVAVDPKVIPLRSLLYIEGYGLAWAGDVGGAIKGEKIDLCFNKTEEALIWGRRKTKVHVLMEVRTASKP